MIFSDIKKYAKGEKAFKASEGLTLSLPSPEFLGTEEFFIPTVKSILGINAETVNSGADITVEWAALEDEEYVLDVNESGITVKASSKRGAIYALSTLIFGTVLVLLVLSNVMSARQENREARLARKKRKEGAK